MADNINHEVFGNLEFDYGWVKKRELELFGEKRELEIVIDADEDADFEPAQIESYKEFFKAIDTRVQDAELATFEFYQKESPDIRAQYGNDTDVDRYVPKISKKEELYKLVTPKQIIFPMVFDDTEREAGFLCDCSWEIEHGLGIKFENEIVNEVGFQDILL
ncbi:hypothetical protein HCJ57_06905 [Listeria booriae]|uniref:DUF6985 domain-containing protein n=1 Tax=Listeria booriae TaxID=1552123 RepID=UPI00162745E1|nr:hypothetical protein [Listeria booriae]MBC1912208.1 hypothetical protein [Listeria booriae]MBC2056226.1 hypothetical protein [Listeria booriae]